MKSAITDYTQNCLFCGRPSAEIHHSLFGTSNRKLCDEDKLLIPVCRSCHTEIHENSVAGAFSKMFGQAIYERNLLENREAVSIEDARKNFRRRYGQSYF